MVAGRRLVVVKRIFDVLVSLIAIVVLLPLFVAIGVLVKLESKGPVFFLQRRSGFNRQPFRIFKFRTMTSLDDGDCVPQATRGDPRTTRVGRWLRSLNLDELPQLFNVLKGEMSLVGPRPHAVAHDIYFAEVITNYNYRYAVKPGITGWAQVNGLRGPTETDDAMRARVYYDVNYIENWSLAFDFYILALTVVSPLAYRNAH